MTKKVRILKADDPGESMIIGWSLGGVSSPEKPSFANFMTERGYRFKDLKGKPEDSRYIRHTEVRPPLTDEDLYDFGALCVGQYFKNGVRQPALLNGPTRETILVVDNRVTPAQDDLSSSTNVIAKKVV